MRASYHLVFFIIYNIIGFLLISKLNYQTLLIECLKLLQNNKRAKQKQQMQILFIIASKSEISNLSPILSLAHSLILLIFLSL